MNLYKKDIVGFAFIDDTNLHVSGCPNVGQTAEKMQNLVTN